MRVRTLYSVRLALLEKSREAALAGAQAYNNPLARFKSETYIVLMAIAWTYLLHAHFRGTGVEYRYHSRGTKQRTFERTETGAFRYWDLSQCLKVSECPLDKGTVNNLRFLIGLRNEVEHHMPPQVDDYLSSRYLACALNYEYWLTKLFGAKYSLAESVALALQFRDLKQTMEARTSEAQLPSRVAEYIRKFDESLSAAEFEDERYAYRLVFVRKAVGKIGQADRVIEFVAPGSSAALNVAPEHWAFREVERPKHRAHYVREQVVSSGFPWFTIHLHTNLWKALDAKNPGKGYGVLVEREWFWYDRWIDEVKAQCAGVRDRGVPITSKLWGSGFRPRPRPLVPRT